MIYRSKNVSFNLTTLIQGIIILRAWVIWLFCKAWVVCWLERLCKCAK